MEEQIDLKRRKILTGATAVVGFVGLTIASVPFLSYLQPNAKTKAAGAPIEVDISKIQPGQLIRILWRKKPVWIMHRADNIIKELENTNLPLSDPLSNSSEQPEYAKNYYRSIKPEISVMVGVCTHLGCSPTYVPEPGATEFDDNWQGGFYCPCHGSKFDLAGRVFSGAPAPVNLVIPPYNFKDDNIIVVGENATS